MRNIFSIVALLALLLTPMTASAKGLDLGELLGRGLGAYGGAKLCGKGPATAVGCGVVGAEIGGALLGPRPNYIQQPQYGQPQHNHPQVISQCQTIALQMLNGQPAVGTACMTPNGYWQIVNVQAY